MCALAFVFISCATAAMAVAPRRRMLCNNAKRVQPFFTGKLHLPAHFPIKPIFCSFLEQSGRFSE